MANQYVSVIATTPSSAKGSIQASKLNIPLVGLDATTIPSLPFTLYTVVTNASTNITLYAPCALRILGARVIKVTTSADAGDVIKVATADGDVTDSMGLNVVAGIIVRAASVNPTKNTLAAGEAITVDPTSSTNCDCQLWIECEAV